jgi:outer membrane biogenesis lipoprotein LolB
MNFKSLLSFVFIACCLLSCKSTKTISAENAEFNLSAKQLIKANKNTKANFKTLQSRVKVQYSKAGKSQSHTITFRVLKDQIIWINSTLSIMRVKITPDKVSFYNKLDQTYFDGDFSLISDFLGTELDFNKVQNLVLGEALFSLQKEPYNLSVHEKSYLLQPKEQPEAFEIFYLLNPSHFKIDSQQLAQSVDARILQIDYLSYQNVGKEIFPQQIKINAIEANEETIIELDFKSIALNDDLRFPFKIPSGFDQIMLK